MSQDEIRIVDTNGKLKSQGKLSPQLGSKALDAAKRGTTVTLNKTQAIKAFQEEKRARSMVPTGNIMPVAPEVPGQPDPIQDPNQPFAVGLRFASKANQKLVVEIISTGMVVQYANATKLDACQPTEVVALNVRAFGEKFGPILP